MRTACILMRKGGMACRKTDEKDVVVKNQLIELVNQVRMIYRFWLAEKQDEVLNRLDEVTDKIRKIEETIKQ